MTPPSRRDRCRAAALTALRVALQGTGLVAVALGAAVVGFSTPQGHLVIEEGVGRGVTSIMAPGWSLDRPRLAWDSTGRLRIEDVTFRDPQGAPYLRVGRLDVLLDLSGWRERRLVLVDPRADGVDVALDSDPDGVLDIVRAFGGPRPVDPNEVDEPWGGLPFELVVRGLSLRDGSYRMHKRAVDGPGRTTLQVAAVSATGDVRLPLKEPRVEVTGAKVQGHFIAPGPAPLSLQGDVTWTGDGLVLEHTTVDLLATHLVVDGTISELSGAGQTDLRIEAAPLDMPSLDTLIHARLQSRFNGVIEAHGPLSGLALQTELHEQLPDGAPGGVVALREGTWVCLPRPHAEPDPCGGPAGDDPELRWMAILDMEHVQLERILPVVRGPLRLEGRLRAAGHGTRWPDGVFVDTARWEGEELDAYGLRVRQLGGDIRLVDGKLLLDDLSLTGVAGTIHGGGTVDLVAGKVDLDLYGPLDLDLLADLDIREVHGRGRYTGHVLVDWKRPGVPVDVEGELWVDNLRYTDGVIIDRAHATYQVEVLRGITEVDAQVDGHGVHPWGAEADLLLVPDLHVHVSDQIRVTGTGATPQLRYSSFIRVDGLTAPFTFDRARKGGVPHVVATAATGPFLLRDLPSDRGTVGVELTGDQLALDVDLRRGAEPYLVLPELHVDLSTLSLDAPAALFSPTAHQTWTTDRPLRLRVIDGGLADADIALSSVFGALALTGDVTTTGQLDGAITLDKLDLTALADLAPDLASDLSGVVDGALVLSGTAAHPRLVLRDLHAEDLILPGLARWMDVEGAAETLPGVGHDTLRLDLHTAVDGEGLLTLRGDLPVRADLSGPGLTDRGEVDLDLTLLPGPLRRFELLLPDTELRQGQISGALHMGGLMRDPDLDLRGVAEVEVKGMREPARIELDLTRRQGQLTTHVDVYEGLHTIARGDGGAETRMSEVMAWLLVDGPEPDFKDPALFADKMDVDLHLLGVDIQTLLAVAQLPALDVHGEVNGKISVNGSPAAPDLRTDLHVDGVASGLPLVADLVVDPGEGLAVEGCPTTDAERPYRAHLTLDQSRGVAEPWIDVCGAIPLYTQTTKQSEASSAARAAATMDLNVGGAGVPLRLLSILDPGIVVDEQPVTLRRRRHPTVTDEPASNNLKVSGHIGGTVAEILPDLKLSTRGARFIYRPMGIALSNVVIDGALRPNPEPHPGEDGEGPDTSLIASITKFEASTSPAAVSFQGLPLAVPSRVTGDASVVLDEWSAGATTGTLTLSQAWILGTDDTQLRASGALAVSGAWPKLVVRAGEEGITVDQGFFSFDANNLLESRDLRLDPAIVVHRGETYGSDTLVEPPSALDALDIQFRLDLGLNTSTHIVMPVLDDLGAIGAQVTRADVESRVGGVLDVHLNLGKPDIGGSLVLRDGEFALLRARFDLDNNSQITFLGADYANPRLDIHGVMEVTGGDVEVDVGGTAGSPTVDFSSEAFGEDGALFTVFTGQPPEDFSSQQARAAVEALSDVLLNSVLGGLNLGSVSVEADGTVTMGIPLYRTIYVESLFKPVPKLNEDRVTVVAEWSILPKLLLTAAYGDRHIWGNLFWEVRF